MSSPPQQWSMTVPKPDKTVCCVIGLVLHLDYQPITTALPACSSSTVQLMRAADYYFQHLDCKLPIIVLSDSATKAQQPSNTTGSIPQSEFTTTPQQGQPNTGPDVLPSAITNGIGDDELDSLLQGGSTDDFNLEALQRPAAATSRQEMDAAKVHIYCLNCTAHATARFQFCKACKSLLCMLQRHQESCKHASTSKHTSTSRHTSTSSRCVITALHSVCDNASAAHEITALPGMPPQPLQTDNNMSLLCSLQCCLQARTAECECGVGRADRDLIRVLCTVLGPCTCRHRLIRLHTAK